MASSSSDAVEAEPEYKRERRPTMSQYVRNHLWWIEWTPCCKFRLRKQTFFNYYKMSRKSIRQEDIAASTTGTDTDGTPSGTEAETKENTYGVMLDYMYSLLETKVTSRELFLKATDQLKCENGSAVYVKETTDLIRVKHGVKRKQGPQSIQSFFDHDEIPAIFSTVTKIGCAEILCEKSYVMLCKYDYVPDTLIETIKFMKAEANRTNPRPPLLTRDEIALQVNKRGKYLSKCVRKRHPETDLCVNSCDFNDKSFFCASVSKTYCDIRSVVEKCGGTCKCSPDSLSFRANRSDDYVRALNDFRINYFGSNVNNLEQNVALEEKARVTVGACANFENEWHFVAENFTTFMDEKMLWYDKYTANKSASRTDKFASGLIDERYKSVGCSYEYCTNRFIYLCLFE